MRVVEGLDGTRLTGMSQVMNGLLLRALALPHAILAEAKVSVNLRHEEDPSWEGRWHVVLTVGGVGADFGPLPDDLAEEVSAAGGRLKHMFYRPTHKFIDGEEVVAGHHLEVRVEW